MLLHRVIGLADGQAGYAYTMRPGMRDGAGRRDAAAGLGAKEWGQRK